MSTYQIGDLQSLFDKQNKRKKSSAIPKKRKVKLENSDLKSDIKCSNTKEKKNKKRSSLKYFTEEIETDFNSNFLPIHNKKKPKRKFYEDSSVENKQNIEHTKTVQAFIRCAKNKRQKTCEKDYTSSFSIGQGQVKDFDEIAANKNASSKNKKLRKNVDTFSKETGDMNEKSYTETEDDENYSKYQFKKSRKKFIQNCVPESSVSNSTESENLFNETAGNSLKCQSKKKQFYQISPVVEEIDSSTKNEKNKIDLEKIRALNLKDLPLTLFVGNLPVSLNRKMLHKLFASFGPIKSVRLRGAVSTKLGIPKKVAEIKGEYHKSLQSHTGFIVFQDRESAKKALSMNGTLIDNHHIVVDFASQAGEKKLYRNDLSIFLGNLPFNIDDETVRSAFEECGDIHALRIVRDKNTGLGKGFGYVQFQETKSKERALTLKDLEINGRKIRIKPIDIDCKIKAGPKKTVMAIRNYVATKRTKEWGNKKSVKKLLKKGRQIHKKKQIARLLSAKFVK